MLVNYLIGEAAYISVVMSDPSGVAVDPGTLRLKFKSPSGVITTWLVTAGQVVKDAVGNYHAVIPLPEAGAWRYRWEADAPNQGAAEGVLNVRKSVVI